MYFWLGTVSSVSSNPLNWSSSEGPSSLPSGDDILVFAQLEANEEEEISEDPPTPPPVVDCDGLTSSTDSFAGVIIQAGYTGTVTLGEELTFGDFSIADGAIAQPTSGTDLTITGEFVWTDGTLNNTTYLANITLTGSTATGLIAPTGAGTVWLGSDFSIEDGAVATLNSGAIDLNKDGIQLSTTTDGSIDVISNALSPAVLGVTRYLQGYITSNTTWTVHAGASFTTRGKVFNDGGTFTLLPEALATITGKPLDDVAYVQNSGGTYLHGGSTLATAATKSVVIVQGILATVYASDASTATATATIMTKTLKVEGGDIYINYQGSNVHFGELLVVGNVLWTGGTFHTEVYANGTTCDVWRTINPGGNSGKFDIDGGTIDVIYLDTDHHTGSVPTTGMSWEVLQAGGTFVDNDAPSVSEPDFWSVEIDPFIPPIYWKVVAK